MLGLECSDTKTLEHWPGSLLQTEATPPRQCLYHCVLRWILPPCSKKLSFQNCVPSTYFEVSNNPNLPVALARMEADNWTYNWRLFSVIQCQCHCKTQPKTRKHNFLKTPQRHWSKLQNVESGGRALCQGRCGRL